LRSRRGRIGEQHSAVHFAGTSTALERGSWFRGVDEMNVVIVAEERDELVVWRTLTSSVVDGMLGGDLEVRISCCWLRFVAQKATAWQRIGGQASK
jgi:hypothetical protein